jgi:hypothetical protein
MLRHFHMLKIESYLLKKQAAAKAAVTTLLKL